VGRGSRQNIYNKEALTVYNNSYDAEHQYMQQGDRRDDTAGGDRRERGFTRGGNRGGSKGGFYGSRGRGHKSY
jgi:hypothetical protein